MPAGTFIEATEVGYAKLKKARHLLTGLDIHLEMSECHVSVSLPLIITVLASSLGSTFQIPATVGFLHMQVTLPHAFSLNLTS